MEGNRLDYAMIAAIRELLAAGCRQVDVAAAMGVSTATIERVASGRLDASWQERDGWPAPPCQTPTEATAGSAAKLEVLRARACCGVELWHPDDNAEPPSPPSRSPDPAAMAAAREYLRMAPREFIDMVSKNYRE